MVYLAAVKKVDIRVVTKDYGLASRNQPREHER